MAIIKSALVALFAVFALAHADETREKKHAHAYTGIRDGGVGTLGYTGQGYGYQPYNGYGAGLGYGSPGYGAGWNTPSYSAAWAAPQTGYGYGAPGYGGVGYGAAGYGAAGYGAGYGNGYGAHRGYGAYPSTYGHGHQHSGYLG